MRHWIAPGPGISYSVICRFSHSLSLVSEDYASMCNLPLSGGRRPYGRDALVAGPVHEYAVTPDYSLSLEARPHYDIEECEYFCSFDVNRSTE